MKVYVYYVRSRLESYRDSSTVHAEDIPFLENIIDEVLREKDFRFFINKSVKENGANGRLEVVSVGREIEDNFFNTKILGSYDNSKYFLTLRYCKNVDDDGEKEEYEERVNGYISDNIEIYKYRGN